MVTVSTVSVEVLNATYQPLGTTKLNRAMALVARGDAVIEEFDTLRTLRHKTGEFMWPKVIRLLRYVKVAMSYADQTWTKAGVLKRDGYTCGYCTKRAGTTIDHILPRAQGGKDEWLNTVSCCQPCNAKKGNRTPEEARMPLLLTPTVPHRVLRFGKVK